MRWPAFWLMLRPARTDRSTLALPVVTFAVITAAVLVGGVLARQFWQAQDNDFGIYKIMAATLVALLVVPVGTLGADAAKLSARRRDERLATLRLLGATPTWVRAVAVAESTLTAAAGVLLGSALHLATAPLLMLLPVQGRTPALEDVWLPWWVLIGTGVTMLLIAAVSALTGLRAVVISPLGVARRSEAPRLSALRLVLGGMILCGGIVLLQLVSPGWGTLGITLGFSVALIAVMAVLGIVGPFVLGRLATRLQVRAERAGDLLAARSVLDSPLTAWRQVSGVALVSFLVVPVGSLLGYLDLIQRSSSLDAATLQAFTDARTMLVMGVGLTFLLMACSVGVSQAAAVLERRRLYVSLARLGMPVSEMDRARRGSVLVPLRVASIGSALAATVMFFWLVSIAATAAPLFLGGIVLLLLAGEGLVRLSLAATAPVKTTSPPWGSTPPGSRADAHRGGLLRRRQAT